MIQTCSQCGLKYLMSHYYSVCDFCGDDDDSWLELRQVDIAVEWSVLCGQVVHGENEAREERWKIS